MHKENKNKDFIQQFPLSCVSWHLFTRVPRRMCVHSSACKQGAAHAASWYSRERTSKTGMEEKKLFYKVVIFVSFAHKILWASKNYGWTTDVTWTILTMSFLPSWALNVALLFMQGQIALRFNKKDLRFVFVFRRWTKVLRVWNDMRVSN